jgi:hypothetical protein
MDALEKRNTMNKQHFFIIGVTTVTLAMILTFLFGLNTPQLERFAHWKQTPSVLVCKHEADYLDASIQFWYKHGFEFDRVQESWYCPTFQKGYIIVSVDKDLNDNTLGRTVFPLEDGNTISQAHVYVKSISYDKRDQITLAHELGHALGFPHTKTNVPWHIMNPDPRRQRWVFED